jgi:hypothetical protein
VCWDNAPLESTWATTKREVEHIHGDWETMTRSQLRKILFDYIETFYSRRRNQARLGRPNTNRDLRCFHRGSLKPQKPVSTRAGQLQSTTSSITTSTDLTGLSTSNHRDPPSQTRRRAPIHVPPNHPNHPNLTLRRPH